VIFRAAWKAMLERRNRLGLALAALTVSATLATALLALYSDLERKLRGEFHGYGPNLILAPAREAGTIPLATLAEADRWGRAVPFLYRIETVNGDPVVVAATDFPRLAPLAGYWEVRGRREPGAGECLIGERVAEAFHLAIGAEVETGGRKRRVAGIVATGGPEDSQILVPWENAPAASLIALRADGERIDQARRALAAALPGVDVRVLRAVVESEAAVVLKIRGTLFLLTALVLGITVLCVLNNFGAVVYQRRKEIGILKAIGGAESRIALLFAAEAAALGVLGSVLGFGLGAGVARWMGWQIFRQPAAFRPETLPLVMAITMAVALAATVAPLRRVRRIEPAVILRGE
jgi:putative ABC transport system permease protein